MESSLGNLKRINTLHPRKPKKKLTKMAL